MARKRLSDLLREEVNKPTPADDSPTGETSTPSLDVTPAKSPGQPLASSHTAKVPSAIPTPEAAVAPPPSTLKPTTAEADLKTALDAALQREIALHQALDQLKTSLAEQQATVLVLTQKLEQTAQIQAELEHAKGVILKLSAAVSTAAQPSPASAPPSSTLTRHNQELKKILQHPIAITPPNSTLSEAEIGWFD